ncbi:S8 family peptidase [Anaerocolumna jejuensis]|uniref:S8 family peptidase n=1 Tax=Anaerocolumna jejuensis TaxID=259063 RepID=UPI003F7B81FF
MDQDCRQHIISDEYADFIVENGSPLSRFLAIENTCQTPITNNHTAVFVPLANIPENMIQTYGYSVFPSCYGLMDISSLESSGVTRIRNIPVFNLRGNGILVGIIDTGIDYTHEAFRNADGTSRIVSIWDQTIQTGPPPEGFLYGSEYTREQLNEALTNPNPLSVVPSTDENGHGTFLSGIIAGNTNEAQRFSGVVPEAAIVVVKLKQAKPFIREFFRIPQDAICYSETDILFGVNYLMAVARSLSLPISICIGFGTSQGAHDERGILSSYLSLLADNSGVGITIAGGNEGNTGHHFQGNIQSSTDFISVDLHVGSNVNGFSMELWGAAPSTFSIDILSPTGEYIPRIPARIGETRVIRFIFEKTVIYVDYQLVESQTGDQLILMRFTSPTEGIWRFRVYSSSDLQATFHIWLPISQFLDTSTSFVEPNPYTTLTSPANTLIPIIVTAYNNTNGSLYLNASRGFTRTNSINPDLAAPGVNLIGPAPGNQYTTMSGTSVAAAHTAGVAAMVLQWGITEGYYTQLDSVEIKNLMLRGARRDPNQTYPNREWGYGILDIYSSFNSLRGETVPGSFQ